MGGGGFTHLHAVSGFSLRYGAGHAARLAERAAERGMAALALTDRDTVAGAVRFAKACERAGVRPVFGAGLAVPSYDALPTGPTGPGGGVAAPGGPGGGFVGESAPRAVFLARNGTGWAALCRMISAAHRATTPYAHLTSRDRFAPAPGPATGTADPVRPGAPGPRLERDDLTGDGLYVLLGPDSEVGRALAAGRPDRAARLLAPWREIYGGALRLEAVCHHGRGEGPGSLRLAARTVGFAAQQGVTAVLSNAVRYPDPGLGAVADLLDAARLRAPVDARRPGRPDGGERWLKGAAAMAAIAERIAEAAGEGRSGAHRLLRATEETADCAVDPRRDLGIGRPRFPDSAVLAGGGERSADRELHSRCAAGLVRGGHEREARYWRRLEEELDTVRRLQFAPYFLTVGRVVGDVRATGVRVAARGAAAGSLVNHLLGITAVDPLEHGLLMERFLSVHRGELPDLDLDVESARRAEVLAAIVGRFGARRVAAVARHETYRVRHAIRDAGAALGIHPATVDRLAKSFPQIRAEEARAALAGLPQLRALCAEQPGRLWELVEALDGLPRGVGAHPSAVLLSDATLLDRTPVLPAGGAGLPVSQFDAQDAADLKLLRLGVIGAPAQSAMAYAVREIGRATGERIDLDDPAQVPRDDPATYELIRSAGALGCFRIGSPGRRDQAARLRPDGFRELVVDIALLRPGPVAAAMAHRLVEARRRPTAGRHPGRDLEEALRETNGVVVFHEQVIRILDGATGCGPAVAEEQRRALSDPRRQGGVRAWFGVRAGEHGHRPEEVRRAWESLSAVGGQGFCKAHAVASAVAAHQSAWLKAHRPAAFYAGLLAHDPGPYPKRLLLADARRRGVPVLAPDVNRSDATCRIERASGRWGLRLGLADIHADADADIEVGVGGAGAGAGIGAAETARLVAGRPYSSLEDLWTRARPGRLVAERLARAGALDRFGGDRAELLLRIAELYGRGRPVGARRDRLPAALEGGARSGAEQAPAGLGAPDASWRLTQDHHAFLAELGAVPARSLGTVRHGRSVLVAGARGAVQLPSADSGRPAIVSTLDDGTGLVDCAFSGEARAAAAHTVASSLLVLVRGVVQRRGPQSVSVAGAAAWDLAGLLELRRAGGLEAVAERLAESSGGAAGADGRRNRGGPERREGGRGVGGRRLWHAGPGSAG
ncbi:PHP domain-containing protein [Streptomyces sp. V4-01]|uniref:DNA-directed DNA polymerase n=1 Tax=Actinacidiphila polyblastidii TaxID=3110430 RepID=A0ABU7PIH2_9ACTN|nr:PHP domain-containing protein [Streptomyces sp. V4-01]